jgi:hypothetical protein
MDIQRLRDIFDKNANFAIIVGSNYGIDEMASALSLYLTLYTQGKDVSVVSAQPPLVEVSNLVGIDRVRQSFESASGDLIVSFPYQGDEIGKVSYTLEAGFLNIIVKPKEGALSFGERDVVFKRSGGVPQVLITVGVERMSEISTYFNIDSLRETTIVNIDKGGTNEGFGDVVIIGQNASSISEQIANIILTLAYPLDPDVSQNLMSGIVQATQDFQDPRTSSLAFEMAGILLRNGAIRESMGAYPQTNQRYTPSDFGVGMGTATAPRAQAPAPQSYPQPAPAPAAAPVRQPQSPVRNTRNFAKEQKNDDLPPDSPDAPPDWLSPKIYKGSTNVE